MANHASAPAMKQGYRLQLTLFLLLAITVLFAGITIGSSDIPLTGAIKALLHDDGSVTSRIILELRLPRVMAAFLVGALLAIAGLLMQNLLQNPLADPYVLGTSGGSAVAVLAGFMLGIPLLYHPLLAIAGALFSSFLLLFIVGRNIGNRREILLLSGIILTTGWGALITFLLTVAPHRDLPGMLFWLVGDLGHAYSLILPGITLMIVGIASLLLAKPMNLMQLGDEQAGSLGVAVQKLRISLLLLAITATSIAVATAGPIGFIGLVTPHLLRLMINSDHRLLIPAAMLLGGTLVMAADILARTLISPHELPVGIFTALLGVPLFLYLLRREVSRQ